MKYELGFIGGGNMAEAIVRAAVDRGVLAVSRICVSDPSPHRVAIFQSLGVDACSDNRRVVASSSQVILAIKPQMLQSIVEDLRLLDAQQQVVVSIMAGIRSEKIEKMLGRSLRIIRVMPNTPLLIGQGMSGISKGAHALPNDDALALRLFEAAGRVVRVAESDMDTITAVSGSGPAYVFYLAEAMAHAAEELGMTSAEASFLSRQTILGAAQLMMNSPDSPAELRRKVTSPGGTTQAAIEHMESQHVRSHIVAAIRRAKDRGEELGSA